MTTLPKPIADAAEKAQKSRFYQLLKADRSRFLMGAEWLWRYLGDGQGLIEELKAENEKLRAERDAYKDLATDNQREIDDLRSEVERLQRDFKELGLEHNVNIEQIKTLTEKLTLEREIVGMLREALDFYTKGWRSITDGWKQYVVRDDDWSYNEDAIKCGGKTAKEAIKREQEMRGGKDKENI